MTQPIPINTSFVVNAVTNVHNGPEKVEFKHLSSCLTDATKNSSMIQLEIDDQDARELFELGAEYRVTFQKVGRA